MQPWYFNAIWKVVKPILPKKMTEKFYICPMGSSPKPDDWKKCPFATQWLDQTSVPKEFGGLYKGEVPVAHKNNFDGYLTALPDAATVARREGTAAPEA